MVCLVCHEFNTTTLTKVNTYIDGCLTQTMREESDLGRREILIITEIYHIPVNLNGRVPTEGRSSRPPIGIMPKELLQESQWVVRPGKSKVSIVRNDMADITLKGTLKQEVVCSIFLYSDQWHLGLT